MRTIGRRLREARGQVAIMMAAFLLLFVVFGFAVIDVGLYMNERRDAQSDVDKIALAGALELTIDPQGRTQDELRNGAIAAAESWATANGIDITDLSLSIDVINTCFSEDGGSDGEWTGVRVSHAREPLSFFISLVSVVDWEASASAVACAGAPLSVTGFLPFALSQTSDCFELDAEGNYQERVGERCDIVVDQNEQGLAGLLGVARDAGSQCEDGNSSGAVLGENIVEGASTTCTVDESSIQGATGFTLGPLRSSLAERLLDNFCETAFTADPLLTDATDFWAPTDALNAVLLATATANGDPYIPLATDPTGVRADGHDDLYEIWARDPSSGHPAVGLIEYNCGTAEEPRTSKRNATLILVRDYAVPDGNSGPKSYLVRGFSRVYLEGCTDSNGEFHKGCDNLGGGPFTIHARFVSQSGISTSQIGHPSGKTDLFIFLKE